jgi:lipopolysaccharide/colanic/teichoic acid biosynthesis glycosyltransferase
MGDMSLVGPRPEVPEYVELYREEFAEILRIRPGLTDPASIKYRNEEEILQRSEDPEREYRMRVLPDKIRLAKEYLAHASLRYDLGVILRTFLRLAGLGGETSG